MLSMFRSLDMLPHLGTSFSAVFETTSAITARCHVVPIVVRVKHRYEMSFKQVCVSTVVYGHQIDVFPSHFAVFSDCLMKS